MTRPAAKGAEDVAQQLDAIEAETGDGTITWRGGQLDVSNLGKVFFPKTKTTKGELLRYYARISLFSSLPSLIVRSS